MKISEFIKMLENSKEHLGDVEIYIHDKEIFGINNEGDHIEIVID